MRIPDWAKVVFSDETRISRVGHASDHLSRLTKLEIIVLPWPADSPDANPIENLWSPLRRQLIYNYRTAPADNDQLWDRVQEQWNGFTVEDCRNLIKSMPKRLQLIIKSKGGPIKY